MPLKNIKDNWYQMGIPAHIVGVDYGEGDKMVVTVLCRNCRRSRVVTGTVVEECWNCRDKEYDLNETTDDKKTDPDPKVP